MSHSLAHSLTLSLTHSHSRSLSLSHSLMTAVKTNRALLPVTHAAKTGNPLPKR